MRNVGEYLASHSFLQRPRWLDKWDLNPYEKELYTQILDLAKLSEQNGYADETGVYVFLTLEQIRGYLKCCVGKARSTIRSLEEKKLLTHVQQGLGKANRYYPEVPELPLDTVTDAVEETAPQTAEQTRADAIPPEQWAKVEAIKQRRYQFQNQSGMCESTIDHDALSPENYRPPF